MITSSCEQACDRQAAWEMVARNHIWALMLINRLDAGAALANALPNWHDGGLIVL
jgi:hypothetical protein